MECMVLKLSVDSFSSNKNRHGWPIGPERYC
jgi:hypothetical protein